MLLLPKRQCVDPFIAIVFCREKQTSLEELHLKGLQPTASLKMTTMIGKSIQNLKAMLKHLILRKDKD